ncbi:MAG: peptidoglycan-associated lipoprotein Pal [Gallionella sp.]|nr:peptidoglycan-associated lipoprotein Pal [Gallionella sp.]
MKKIIISFALLGLLAACSTPKPKVDEPPPAPAVVEPAVDTTALNKPSVDSAAMDLTEADKAVAFDAQDPLSDPNSILAKRSVFYAVDVYTVADADKPLVQAHAKYLSEHPERRLRLEGNADEQGSNEYNLALGQRRADAVKKMLLLGGAKDNQVEAFSYGEEKPKAEGHDETAWSQNRRTDFNYRK